MHIRYNFLRFPEGKSKAVTLSYDDGCAEDVRLLETIDRYGLKCTFNLVGSNVEAGRPLSVDFIKNNILAHGHEVAVHGYLHRAQNKVRPIAGIRDTLDCRITLERTLGRIIRGMAYPDCAINRAAQPDLYETLRAYMADLDIAYIRSAMGDNDSFSLPDDWYLWMPTAHHDNGHITEYIDKFVSLDVSAQYIAQRHPRLFYLWGHAFEFERNQNWAHLEEIAAKLGGRDDIWYATNIEIHDYVTAYKQLKYSADESIVYNPTLFDIWFDIDRTLYKIKPGETITLG